MLLQIFVWAAVAAFLEEVTAALYELHRELQADEELGSRKHPGR